MKVGKKVQVEANAIAWSSMKRHLLEAREYALIKEAVSKIKTGKDSYELGSELESIDDLIEVLDKALHMADVSEIRLGNDIYIKDEHGQKYYGVAREIHPNNIGGTFGSDEIMYHNKSEIFKA